VKQPREEDQNTRREWRGPVERSVRTGRALCRDRAVGWKLRLYE
jgi:hypothetical protein